MKITREEYDEAIAVVLEYRAQLKEELHETESSVPHNHRNTYLHESDASTRLKNVLRSTFRLKGPCTLHVVSVLVTLEDILKVRSAGKGMIREYTELMQSAGLKVRKS